MGSLSLDPGRAFMTSNVTLLTTAFSFGRDHDLLRVFGELISAHAEVALHDLRSDIDANRTWVALSGSPQALADRLLPLCAAAFDRINLERHIGEYPRLGALDFGYWTYGGGVEEVVEHVAHSLADLYDLPVYLIHRSDAWYGLREQGFGSLFERTLAPIHGPNKVNESLGVTGLGIGPYGLTVSVDVEEERADFLKMRVRDIRQRREDGEQMFAGVEAIAYAAPSDNRSRMILEFADPDHAPPDPVIEWLDRRARIAGLRVQSVEAIGAVRRTDLLETRTVPVREAQIIDL